jgi:hypothetical protein
VIGAENDARGVNYKQLGRAGAPLTPPPRPTATKGGNCGNTHHISRRHTVPSVR